MMHPVSRREKALCIEAMLASWAYQNVLLPEIARLIEKGGRDACNLKLPQAERDGGAGAKAALEAIREHPAAFIRFLEGEAKKENKKATSAKLAKKQLR